jgi:hypothetical protein
VVTGPGPRKRESPTFPLQARAPHAASAQSSAQHPSLLPPPALAQAAARGAGAGASAAAGAAALSEALAQLALDGTHSLSLRRGARYGRMQAT